MTKNGVHKKSLPFVKFLRSAQDYFCKKISPQKEVDRSGKPEIRIGEVKMNTYSKCGPVQDFVVNLE